MNLMVLPTLRRLSAVWTLPLTLAALVVANTGCNSILGIERATDSSAASGGTSGEDACKVDANEAFISGCVFRLGCDPGPQSSTLSGCLTYKTQGLLPTEQATLNATSCSAVEQSLGRRYEPPDLCTGQTGWSCSASGDVATYCGPDAAPFSRDCRVVGAKCTALADALPSVEPCGFADLTTCRAEETSLTTCEGDLQLGCQAGAPVGFDCAVLGTKCVESAANGAFCSPNGAECDPELTFTCTGDDVLLCPPSGVSSLLECYKGSKCDDPTGGTPSCVIPGCEPKVPCEEGCVGTTGIRFCVAGVALERDCQDDYGFDRCEESSFSASASSSVTAARCAIDGSPPPGTTADWSGSLPDTCVPLDYPLDGCDPIDVCQGPTGDCFFRVNTGDKVPYDCTSEDYGVATLIEYCSSL